MKTRTIVPVAIAITLIGLVFWKLGSNKNSTDKKLKESMRVNSTVPVIVETPKLREFAIETSLHGVILPDNEVLILSKAPGTITRKLKEMGDSVKKGDVIVQIENEVLKKALSIAQADHEQRSKDVERYLSLQRKGAVAQQEVENSQMSLRALEERIADLQDQIASTSIKAPSPGVISKDFVEARQWVDTGSEIVHIISGVGLKLQVNASEADVLEIKKGQQAKIHLSSLPGESFKGVVEMIAPKANELHFYTVEISLDSKDNQLKPGMYAVAELESAAGKEPKMTISRKSIIGGLKKPAVFIVKNGKAYKKSVKPGYYDDKILELKSGLSVNDTIVYSGQVNLTDGAQVSILNKL